MFPKNKKSKNSKLISSNRFSARQLIGVLVLAAAAGIYLLFRIFAASNLTVQIPQCPLGSVTSFVPAVGNACKLANGLLRVQLADGTAVTTHGGDDPSQAQTARTINGQGAPSKMAAPLCVDPGSYHNHLIYATLAGQPDRYDSLITSVLHARDYANGRLQNEGNTFGLKINYRFWCGVDRVQLNTSNSDFNSVVSDLRAKGFTSQKAKYWIYLDTSSCGGGVGTIQSDESLSPNNANNISTGYALDLGCTEDTGGFVMMHENGHNLGAVQPNAPHSTAGWHCTDGADTMCYNDGSARSNNYTGTICSGSNYDCHNDDYFNPSPPPGSYLANHWNVGSGYDNFIDGLPPGKPPEVTAGFLDKTACDSIVGWAEDSGRPTTALDVHIYIGGPTGTAGITPIVVKANGARSDSVNGHGFTVATPAKYKTTSPYPVYAYTFDAKGNPVQLNYDGSGPAANHGTLGPCVAPDRQAPTVPTGLRQIAATYTSVGIAWTPSRDNVKVTGYQVFMNGNLLGKTTDTSYKLENLQPGWVYYFAVTAYDAANNVSAKSAIFGAQATPDTSPPTTPTNLQTTSRSTSSIGFSWSASTDNVGVAGYRIYRNGNLIATTNSTSYTDSGLQSNTNYTYQVSAFDSTGNDSPLSSSLTVKTYLICFYLCY